MQKSSLSKSEVNQQQLDKNLIWKKNDGKAQKNGAHSNIYWVKVVLLEFRNRHLIKMDQKNKTVGLDRTSMWVIGAITRRTALVFSIIPTGINTKEGGVTINGMDRALIGSQTQRTSFVVSTQAIVKTTPNKVEELCSIKVEIGMMECGWIINLMAKGA